MSIDVANGHKFVRASDGAVELIPARAERLGFAIENTSDAEFRFLLGTDMPTPSIGFLLARRQSISAGGILTFDKKDATTDYFIGPINIIAVGQGEGQLQFLEIFSV